METKTNISTGLKKQLSTIEKILLEFNKIILNS